MKDQLDHIIKTHINDPDMILNNFDKINRQETITDIKVRLKRSINSGNEELNKLLKKGSLHTAIFNPNDGSYRLVMLHGVYRVPKEVCRVASDFTKR